MVKIALKKFILFYFNWIWNETQPRRKSEREAQHKRLFTWSDELEQHKRLDSSFEMVSEHVYNIERDSSFVLNFIYILILIRKIGWCYADNTYNKVII